MAIVFENRDCLEAMKEFPDKFFDLAIVDPPYGDGKGGNGGGRFGGMFQSSINGQNTRRPTGGGYHGKYYHGMEQVWGVVRQVQTPFLENPSSVDGGGERAKRTGGTWASKYAKKIIAWDIAPPKEYFEELFRISRNQIIFGGNYFDLPPTRCFVIFRKTNIPAEGFSMSPVEYAWTSFNRNAECFEGLSQSFGKTKRFHPTQKPVALYEWLLTKFANEGDKILDTHCGSGSSLIACYNLGFDVWAYEIDKEYYEKASERLKEEQAQIRVTVPKINETQMEIRI